jgi:hypothetical protein
MAWTRDIRIARWFAERDRDMFQRTSATVYVATVEPPSVLAVIQSRAGDSTGDSFHPEGEAEIVVDPAGLLGVHEQREAP